MSQMDLEKLLGGYATGTLTEEERKALFEAALRDQALFNALENEHALKELLDDPRSRRRLLEALEKADREGRGEWVARAAAWLQRPSTWALAGGLAVAVLAVTFTVRLIEQVGPPPAETDMAARSRALPQSQPAPAPIPRAAEPTQADRMSSGERAKATQPAEKKSSLKSLPAEAAREPVPPAGTLPLEAKVEPRVAKVPAPEAQREFARAPEPAMPEAKPQKAQPPTAAVPSPGKPSATAEGFQASGVQSYQEGKARALFYARGTRPEPDPGRLAEEPMGGALRTEKPGLTDVERKEAERSAQRARESAKAGAVAKTAVKPLGLRYSLLKRGPDGSETEVDPAGPLTGGDTVRLTVEGNDAGYLYVLRRDPSGLWTVLVPQTLAGAEQAGAAGRVPGRTRAVVPPSGSLTVEGQPGQVQVFIVFSREPHRELTDILISSTRDAASAGKFGARIDEVVNRAHREIGSQPLLIEKVDVTHPSAPREQAVYVVNPGPDLSSPIVIDLALSSR